MMASHPALPPTADRAERDDRTAEESTRPVRRTRNAQKRRKTRRNGNTRKTICHQFLRMKAEVSGATHTLKTNSATKIAHSSQPTMVSYWPSVLPVSAIDSANTTNRKRTARALMAGVKRSNSWSDHSCRALRSRSGSLAPSKACVGSPASRIVTTGQYPWYPGHNHRPARRGTHLGDVADVGELPYLSVGDRTCRSPRSSPTDSELAEGSAGFGLILGIVGYLVNL
jgi:hypothetical protein